MSRPWCNSLKVGDAFVADFMVQDLAVKEAKNGSKFAMFKLQDKTGSLAAKKWQYDPVGNADDALLKSGQILNLTGRCEEYQGKMQVIITSVSAKSGSSKESDFVKRTEYDIDELWSKMVDHAASLKNGAIRRVAEDLLLAQGYSGQFKFAPAATGNHHAFIGGLIEHTAEMCDVVKKLFELPFVSKSLNYDLCMFGVMFHDFGKIFEYSNDPGFKKTVGGVLVGHISQMSALIFETCNKYGVDERVRDHLMHVILAHHGKVEWGSPIPPAIPEAWFVHFVDNLHGTTFGALQLIANANPAEDFASNYAYGKLVTKRFDTIVNSEAF